MKKLFTIIALLIHLCINAQNGNLGYQRANILTSEYNLPREGDSIAKLQIPHISVEDKGEDCIWHYNLENIEAKDYIITYHSYGDIIADIEHGTVYYDQLHNDSLLRLGYENKTTRMEYIKPCLELRYPFHFGDSISSNYCGKGLYGERLNVGVWGRNYVVADGTGILTDGRDTLKNILRLHKHYEIVRKNIFGNIPQNLFASENISKMLMQPDCLIEDHFLWYLKGWRYPVMESIETFTLTEGVQTKLFGTSFLYLPEWQDVDMPFDYDNNLVRNESQSSFQGAEGTSNTYHTFPVIMSAHLDESGTCVVLDYTQTEDGTLKVIACDTFGRPLGSSSYNLPSGTHEQTLILRNQPAGGIVILYMEMNEAKSNVKISLNK